MAMDEFANCFSAKVEVTVDGILALCEQVGEDGLRAARDAWNSLGERDRAVISWVAGASSSALKKILERVLGVAVAEAFIVFLGGVSWGILIGSFIACADDLL
jgi:hypothetical protein